jgi:hypothetical protein
MRRQVPVGLSVLGRLTMIAWALMSSYDEMVLMKAMIQMIVM